MKNAVIAVFASVAAHAALVAAIAFGLSRGSAPEVSVSLDLSNVELSFAEQEDESAAAAAPSTPDTPPPAMAPSPERPELPRPLEPVPSHDAPPPPENPDFPKVAESAPEIDAPPTAPLQEVAPSAPLAPRQAKVDAPPRPRQNIKPDYPKSARERGEQGDVMLEISVDGKGVVDGEVVVSSSGFAELDEAAVRAARRARFSPAKAGGRSVASRARLKLEFKLK